MTSTKHKTAVHAAMALGLLLATLLAEMLVSGPAGAALESAGNARAWGYNGYGQLGNDNTGTGSDVPVGVKNLTNVKSIDGGQEFTLAATQ